ncbi:cytochrome c-type biogenesis protein CcmH [Sulfitobacter brevis]|uniref:Cytochrome c-type biogenesis protein CcmH n=1 Tax=Sulfitobacter brevis TaxID=74348 RepID=A0A1I2EUT3_9RHOB|nr:cytochrome c-type biogenesis protein CcmH [Sulfitobacter brevis]
MNGWWGNLAPFVAQVQPLAKTGAFGGVNMVTFWIIAGAMVLAVAGFLIRAVAQGTAAALPARGTSDLGVYRDQLAEVDRDVARGVVPEADAAQVRNEISRRILAADEAATLAGGRESRTGRVVLIAFVIVAVFGSLALYARLGQPGYGDLALADRIARAEEVRKERPSQEEVEESMPAFAPTALSAQYVELLTKLRDTVAERPDDLQGHKLLAENEANIGNFAAAARAQREVMRIEGAPASAQTMGDYAELLILAAGGYVSPQAETALRAVLALDAEDGRARYFLGLMMAQTGRPDVAFRLWDALLRRGPEDAPWIVPIRAQIMPLARLAGVDYALPPVSTSPAKGPSTDDIAAASEMTPADRQEMIGAMVAGLSDRLATEGGPVEDWARLITSLGVLKDAAQARAVFDNAMAVFAGDEGALDKIRAAGSQAGVAE